MNDLEIGQGSVWVLAVFIHSCLSFKHEEYRIRTCNLTIASYSSHFLLGPCHNIKTIFSGMGDSLVIDNTVVRSSYL